MNFDGDRPKRVVVIGAGAAGMVAAAEAAKRGAEVTLLEKNTKTGVKILMSGGTRCNITHNTDARGIVAAFGKSGRFLQPSVGAFPPMDVVQMFHSLGVETKVEETGKVFPVSDRAVQVRDALHAQAVDAGVKLLLCQGVVGVSKTENGWTIQTKTDTFEADTLVVTAGGKSWPGCGTTGDAYAWLTQLGHSIVRTRPALVPLVGGDQWSRDLSGVTIDDIVLSVRDRAKPKRPVASRRSSLLLTHFGFSGPAAMDVSGAITEVSSPADRQLEVDWIPDIHEETLKDRLTDRSAAGRRRVGQLVGEWLPSRLAAAIVGRVTPDVPLSELSKKAFLQLVSDLKRMPLPITGTRGFDKAEVTAGGVTLSEVDPRTMASRLVDGLYIAGEVLDVDGNIGGFNFQAAFSTGRAAGIAAATTDASLTND